MSELRRIEELEDRTQDLEIRNAELTVEIRHMNAAIGQLTESVKSLNSTMERGRGALWVLVGASSVVGAVIATMISNAFGKGS